MITPRNIEDQIENQIIILLELDDYIIDNDLPVRGWFDLNTETIGRQIIVHANSAIPTIYDEMGSAKEYEVRIDLLSYIHNTEDETPNTEINTIYQIVFGFSEQVLIADIQNGLTDLTVNGKTNNDNGEEYDERFYTKVASFSLYIEI